MKILSKYIIYNLIILFVLSCGKETDREEIINYLESNYSVIDTSLNYNIAEFDIMADDLTNNTMFLFGEDHGTAFNHTFDIKILKYLYYTGKVSVKVLPLPTLLFTSIVPPWASTNRLAIVRPNPLPPVVLARDLSTL